MSKFYSYEDRYWKGIWERKDSDSIYILQVELGIPRCYAKKLHYRYKRRALEKAMDNHEKLKQLRDKMKVIYNNTIPWKGYKAINLFGIVFVRKDAKTPMTQTDFNHELIHTKQMKEMLYIFFYLWYLIEYFFKLIAYGFNTDKAYYAISFEREAYCYESHLEYPDTRKHYAWLKYL